MNAQAIIAMLAIARLGAAHSVILLGSQLVPLKTESTMLVVKLLSLVMKVKSGRTTNIKNYVMRLWLIVLLLKSFSL